VAHHEWLSGLVFHAWESAFGRDALVVWQWLVLAAAFGLLFDLLRRWCPAWAAWLLLLGALAVAAPFFDIRPHLWSLLGTALVLRLTLVPSSRARLALPPLFAVWANLHGGVVFGLAVLGTVLLAQWLLPPPGEEGARLRRRLPWIGLACALATLLNPFGARVLTYPLGLALAGDSPSRQILVEWLPPFRAGGIQSPLYPWALAAAAAVAIALARRLWRERRADTVAALLLLLGTTAMSLTSRRFITLFAMALAVAAARLLAGRWRSARGGRAEAAVLAVALAVAALRLHPYPLGPRAFAPLVRLDRMPEETVRFALANGISGDVFAYFLWGGYLHYRSGGQLRVFLDPRSETVFGPEVQRRYRTVARMAPGWQDVIARSGAELVLWPFSESRPVLQGLLATGDWRVVHGGPEGVLLARADLALPATMRPVASGWRSWALAREAVAAGRLAEAEERLGEALAAEPTLVEPCVELVELQRRRGRAAEAAATAERCDAIFPGVVPAAAR
jgi:hypothetical protein